MAVAAANKHSAAVTVGGEVFTWGSNRYGQLGYGTTDSCSSPAPRPVDFKGAVGLKGRPQGGGTAAAKGRALGGAVCVAVSASKRHTLALTADGEIFTWGHTLVTPRRVQLQG